MEGYKWHFNETVLTVWSAPNYCYRSDNEFSLLFCNIVDCNMINIVNIGEILLPVASRYYDRCGNVAAILELDEHLQVSREHLINYDADTNLSTDIFSTRGTSQYSRQRRRSRAASPPRNLNRIISSEQPDCSARPLLKVQHSCKSIFRDMWDRVLLQVLPFCENHSILCWENQPLLCLNILPGGVAQ